MIYLAPLKKWVVDILKYREDNPMASNSKMPYIIMTSAAKVITGKPQSTKLETLRNVEKIIKDQIKPEYQGCIISNQLNPSINYSNGLTPVGYDFTGKLITAARETGRKVPQPIIESLEIDTDGTNNTLKTARINVRCFTLKQFEMFELFFCKAGMHILIEYGDNSFTPSLNIAIDKTLPNGVMIDKTDYNKFVETFKQFTNPTTKQFAEYLNRCRISKGSYDRVAGKLINYGYSIEQDGTYSVNLEVAQSNEYNLALPKAFITKYSSFSTPSKDIFGFKQWKNKLINDLPGLKKSFIDSLSEKEWSKHFFNWGKTNETKVDESASNEPYLSLQFILEILVNNAAYEGGTAPEFKFKVPEFKLGSSNKKIIPITVHEQMISSSDIVIFPHKNIPEFTIDEKTSEIKIKSNTSVDGEINGLSIMESESLSYDIGTGEFLVQPKVGFKIGNALNIFVRYREVGEAWEKNYTVQDFLVDILNRINENSYELFRLRLGNLREDSEMTVLDILLTSTYEKLKNQQDGGREEYRFKPTTLKSNVRDFKFNFELGDQLAAATIFNSSKFLAARKFEKEYEKNKGVEDGLSLPKGAYQSIDYSSFSTADGYYAINAIEYHQLLLASGIDSDDKKKIEEEVQKEKETLQKSYESKTKKFKIKKGDVRTLVFLDKSFIATTFKFNDAKVRSQFELLTPIKVNVTIDGISGITCGETFKIDGIPEQYNKLGSFQITNTKHVVNNEQGWTTEIEGEYRYGV